MDRGVLRDTLSTTNSAVNCGEAQAIVRGVSWLKIVRYKNIELTLTTRQLHSRELLLLLPLPTARPTQSKVRVSPTSHTFLLHEHGAVTRRAASGVAFVRVLGPVEERPVADQEKAGQEKPRIRDHESKFQVVKLVGGSTNGMPRSMSVLI